MGLRILVRIEGPLQQLQCAANFVPDVAGVSEGAILIQVNILIFYDDIRRRLHIF